MMKRALMVLLTSMVVGCLSSPENLSEAEQADVAQSPPKWQKLCDVPPGPLADVAAAEVMLLQPQFVHGPNGDGTFNIDTQPFVSLPDGNGNPLPLDPASVFYGDLKMLAGRSGVMIGPDLVLTAPHKTPLDPTVWLVIRGLGSHATAGGCQEADFAHVPAANIFYPQLPIVANTFGTAASGMQPDYMAFHLDRPTGSPYLRIRRSGAAQIGDQAMEVDHANRFSTRVSPDGTFYGSDPANHALLVNGIFALDGSSGGMLYNLTSGYVEGVVANGGGCAGFTYTNGVYKLIQQCPASPASPNRQIVDVAAQFPAYSLVTAPIAPVTHVAASGAAPTLPTTMYTITAPMTTGGSSVWQLVKPADAVGEPGLSFAPAATSGTLAPGAVQTLTVTATPGSQCGIYNKTFSVIDPARGFTDTIPHRFEIGMTEFTVAAATDFSVEKMLPPYGSTSYTLSNPRPSPITVLVQPPSFVKISVSGAQVTPPTSAPVTVALGAAGSGTATAQILVNLQPPSPLPAGVPITGDLTVTNQAINCKITSTITRHIQLTPGKQTFEQLGPQDYPPGPPPGSTFGAPLTSSQTITDNFIIDSIALDVAFYEWPTYFVAYELSSTKIVLVSPDGQQFVLWDRNAVMNPASYSIETLTIGGYPDTYGVVHISDMTAPSPVGTLLSPLVGQSGMGTWQLVVYSAGTAPAFMDWSLHLMGHVPCSVSTCASGCCQSGICVNGTSNAACGIGGSACQSCAVLSSCVNNACQLPGPVAKPCGNKICAKGSYCCNASCGICVPIGNSCTQQYCPPSQ